MRRMAVRPHALASLADTLMPEAYRQGGAEVVYATALGFLLSFMVSSA